MYPTVAIGSWIALTMLAFSQVGYAESAIALLSGFDRERIDAAYPPTDDQSAGELAKLVYRLQSVDPNSLKGLAADQSEVAIGDVIPIDGRIEATATLAVPSKLVEFLEFSQLHVIDVQETQRKTRLIAASVPQGMQIGDRVSAISVVVDASLSASGDGSSSLAVVSNSLQWFPETYQNIGQQLLSESGFDLGLLAGVAARNRRRLMAEDGAAFYAMLATAASLGDRPDLPTPTDVDPVALLKSPQDMLGQWVHMDLESVQITRIALTDSRRQEQLGSDQYFQIDAVGDLDGVVIKIENVDKSIAPATFQGRYPVSIVTKELPDFLHSGIRNQSGGDAVVAPIRHKFGMDGFFFRLWGYESDFMSQQGGGEQFGPLLMAARFQNQEPLSEDPVGVGVIGTVAAIALLTAMATIWWWQRRAWAADDEARRRRQEYQSDQFRLPQ